MRNDIRRNHNVFYIIDCSYLFNQQISKMKEDTKELIVLALLILGLVIVVIYSVVNFIIQ